MTQILPEPIQFGRYTLYERIGRGGMADVFKARILGPAGFERVFVIKRILPQLSDDPSFAKMLIQEAKLSARLIHANIVQIFELGAVDGEYFISMEHVPGHDLAATTRAMWKQFGAPRPELVAFIGREICRGLAYAHDLLADDGRPQGMIHRDVSPPNVMLAYEGAVKLVDFGIAKALGDAPEITKNGTVKGKYAYMAPEQTEGGELDHRIDIFATGIVMHEVLTGRRLFKGSSDLDTVERVRQCDVRPPSEFNRMCPRSLDDIVMRALSKNPDDRFPTAGEMADALDDVVHAARFTPQHLAGILRVVFAGEAGTSSAGERRLTTSSSLSANSSATIQPVAIVSSIDRSPSYRATRIDRATLDRGRHNPPSAWWRRRASWAVTAACAGVIGLALATSGSIGKGNGGGGLEPAAGATAIRAVAAAGAPHERPALEAMPAPSTGPEPTVPSAAAARPDSPNVAALRGGNPAGAQAVADGEGDEGPRDAAAGRGELSSKKGRPQRPLRKPRGQDRAVAATTATAPATAVKHAAESGRGKSRSEIVDPFIVDPVVVNPF